MLPRLLRTRALLQLGSASRRVVIPRRTLVSAPKLGDGPLMERRPDRELPEIPSSGMKWARTIPVFLVVLVSCALGIFNYQKSNSSVVASTLYALRTNEKAREVLGDEIYFASQMPWIWGEMNQLHGRINIQFEVKGNKATGTMRFTSFRETRRGMFETTEWSLETKDGQKVDLLDMEDPFKGLELDADQQVGAEKVGRGSYSPPLSS